MSPDEFAYLGMARSLTGGRWTNFSSNTYQPGLSAILAPGFVVIDDPTWRYRFAIALGCVVGGASAVVLLRLLSRLRVFTGNAAAVVAGALALSPASLTASDHVWAEPYVTLIFLVVVLLMIGFFDDPRLTVGVAAVGSSVAGYLFHGRLLPLVGVVVLVVGGHYLRHRDLRRAVVVLLAGLVLWRASVVFARFMFERSWLVIGDTNSTTAVLERLAHPADVAVSAVGQIWYLLIGSLLVAAFGAVELVRRAFGTRAVSGTLRVADARILVVLTLPLIITSVVFMSGRTRVDHLMYGRYNEAIIWPILAIGLAWLIEGTQREAARSLWWKFLVPLLLAIEAGVFLQIFHGPQLASGTAVMEMLPGLDVFVAGRTVRPIAVTAISIAASVAVFIGCLRCGRSGCRTLPLAGLVVWVFALGLTLFVGLADTVGQFRSGASFAQLLDDEFPDVDVLGVALVPDQAEPALPFDLQVGLISSYQWYDPELELSVDAGFDDDVGPFVLAPSNDLPMNLVGGTPLWRDPDYELVLWEEPVVSDAELLEALRELSANSD